MIARQPMPLVLKKSAGSIFYPVASGEWTGKVPPSRQTFSEPGFHHDFSLVQSRQTEVGGKYGGRQETDMGQPPSVNSKIILPACGATHPVADWFSRPGVRFRVPQFDRLKAAYSDKDLKIPEAVIKQRVTELLERMEADKRLKSKDSVADIVAKIFPAPGKMDETEFNNAVDINDRKEIYASVADADTQLKTADKPKLQTAMTEAADLVKTVQGNATGLKEVFGTKDVEAKANYAKAEKALRDLPKNLDAHVTTDYNLDDPEVGLGGWANFSSQRMHLLLKVAQVEDPKETKATVIHEASHFANPSVDDQVYYGRAGFFELDEDKKIANAAHYEELPRRELGVSKFDKKKFTPGVSTSGGVVTREEQVKAAVDLFLRHAWDAGVDAHTFIRGVRRQYLAGDNQPFNDNKAIILEMSKLMDLTVHEQAAGKQMVTTLDVTLSESVSRGVAKVMKISSTVAFPSSVGTKTDDELRDKMVADSVVQYGQLLKDPARDKALLDWLDAHYRKMPAA